MCCRAGDHLRGNRRWGWRRFLNQCILRARLSRNIDGVCFRISQNIRRAMQTTVVRFHECDLLIHKRHGTSRVRSGCVSGSRCTAITDIAGLIDSTLAHAETAIACRYARSMHKRVRKNERMPAAPVVQKALKVADWCQSAIGFVITVPILSNRQLAMYKMIVLGTGTDHSEPRWPLKGDKILLTGSLFLFLPLHLLTLALLFFLGTLALVKSLLVGFLRTLLLDRT